MHPAGITFRSLFVFFALESILAGVLAVLNAFSGLALIVVGIVALGGLWVWDNRPQWIPAKIRSPLGLIGFAAIIFAAGALVFVAIAYLSGGDEIATAPIPIPAPTPDSGLRLRTLSAPAQTEMLACINGRIPEPASVEFEYLGNDGYALAQTLASIFDSAGWRVTPVPEIYANTWQFPGVPVEGADPQIIEAVADCLRRVGIGDARAEVSDSAHRTVKVRVGFVRPAEAGQ